MRGRKKESVPPEPLDAILEKTISRLGLKKSSDQWKAVHLWPKIVGKEIARLSRPLYVTDGILFVGTPSSSWAHELDFQKKEILKRLEAGLGGGIIRDIRFYSTLWKEGDAPAAVSRPVALDAGEMAFVAEISCGIESEQLKRAVEKMVTRWLAREKSRR